MSGNQTKKDVSTSTRRAIINLLNERGQSEYYASPIGYHTKSAVPSILEVSIRLGMIRCMLRDVFNE